MKNTIKRIIFGILVILNCGIIFYFSHQVGDNSSKQSGSIVEIISNIIPYIKNMEEVDRTIFKETVLAPIVRRIAHFSIYAMLGLLTTNFMLTIEKRKTYIKVILALLFCVIYAITDEFHQTFIAGRSGRIIDVFVDTLGALTGIIFIVGITNIIRKIKNRKEMLENKS